MPPIPITILTGFLGSGKTTILLNLIPQLPPTYRLALLKNEFGDVAVDSQLASARAISGVRELLNGCICCNLVGQLSDALAQLRSEVRPDRIVIETSGSAFPATLVMEINRVVAREREAGDDETRESPFTLDGVVSVVDVENWAGYEDTSYTAKLQARYTDLIVFNKWEDVGERRFDICLDRVGDLDVQTAWVKSDRGWVDKDVLLGIDGALISKAVEVGEVADDQKEHHHHDHHSEVEVLSVSLMSSQESATVDSDALTKLLSSASKEEVYRIKGTVRCSTDNPPRSSDDPSSSTSEPKVDGSASSTTYILNWAFGRWTFTPVTTTEAANGVSGGEDTPVARLIFILARYESAKWKKKLEAGGLLEVHSDQSAQLHVQKIA
jgi:G3E family GTPase